MPRPHARGTAEDEESVRAPMLPPEHAQRPRTRAPEEPPLADALPMRARLGDVPREAEKYAAELKWDGIRALVHVWDGKVRVRSRLGRDVTASFPELREMAHAIEGEMVLDGEIVAFDDEGRPSFERLQQRLGATSRDAIERGRREATVVFVIFDILYLEGMVTMGLPYRERRQLLDELSPEGSTWTTPPSMDTPAAALLEAVRSRGLEGVVLKKRDSVYVPGHRSDAWIKVKLTRRQEFVVGGWAPGAGTRRGSIGALLLGVYDTDGRLHHAGSVGTGFTQEQLARLHARLATRQTATSPFVEEVGKKGVVYVEPELVVEVEFTEWTKEGRLRHPSFQGVRDDVDPRSVVREEVEG